LCGNECEGYYFRTPYAAHAATPAAAKFIKAFQAKYNAVPDDVAALTYDAFELLWLAIKSAGSIDRQAVRDALAKVPTYDGVTGMMQFKEGSGDPIKGAVILKIKEGKFTYFTTANP
ncbi:MAG: ABC transporter substrate-binding protein, partial [Syntrophales bacterium LBB04]|nr:ABC transporter substrate-binding protein [Syntrophales bacterium LBB04]